MTCENREKFTISQIILDRNLIHDSKGNYLFIIESYTSPEQFSCDISLNSIALKTNDNIESPSSSSSVPSSSGNEPINRTKKSSGGLSAGAIAGIIVGSVVVVAAIVIFIVLIKKGTFSRKIIMKKPEEYSTTYEITKA